MSIYELEDSEPELKSVVKVMAQLDIKGAIEEEVKWCEEHRGMKSHAYEEGFIAGLKQVLFFIAAHTGNGE